MLNLFIATIISGPVFALCCLVLWPGDQNAQTPGFVKAICRFLIIPSGVMFMAGMYTAIAALNAN